MRYIYPHCSLVSIGSPWGASLRFELGPAIQQADAPLTELRRTLSSRSNTHVQSNKLLVSLQSNLMFLLDV